jgi:hypothetical protein
MAAKSITSMPSDLRKRIDAIGKASQAGAVRTVRKAAEAAKREQDAELRRDSGGDMVLSGTARRGRGARKVGSTIKIRDGNKRSVTAEIKAVGPVPLIANNTVGHVIRSAYVRGTYRTTRTGGQILGPAAPTITGNRRAVLNILGVGFRRSARHPGTKGKDTWNEGRRKATIKVREVIDRESDNAVRDAFRRGA